MIERTDPSKDAVNNILTKKKRRNNNNKIHHAQELSSNQSYLQTFRHPERELFVYSLLFIRPEASEYFWEDMLCKTSAALFAILVSKTILNSSGVRVDINLQIKVENMHDLYEFRAKGILNTCYDSDAKRCQTVLKAEHEPWGSKTCLDLAIRADCKDFIAQSGCQTLVREVWLGKLSDRNPYWRIVGAALIPFFVYALWFKVDVSIEQAELEQGRKRLNADDSETSGILKNNNKGDIAIQKNSPTRPGTADLQVLNSEDSLLSSSKMKNGELNMFYRYKYFYTAPIVTFILNLIATVAFLVLFSIVTLDGLKKTPRVEEYVIIFWMLNLALEELRQFVIISESTLMKRIDVFFENKWNAVDLVALTSFVPGLVMRMNEDWDLLNVAHGFYVVTLILYFIRFTSVFSMHNYLGPKIVMISKMLTDLGFFFCIALVYVVAYGVAVQSLIYPGITQPAFSIPWGVFFRSYFEMLGEPNFEEIGATHFENCTEGSEALWPMEDCPDERKTVFAIVLKALYMLFTNVLLLNLLIAIFNNRYEDVNKESNVYWKFQVFEVIKEHYNRPWLPPPFIIVSHVYTVIVSVKNMSKPQMKRLTEKPRDPKKLEKWEDIRAKEFASLTEKRQQENIEERVRKIENRSIIIDKATNTIKGELQEIQKSIQEAVKEHSSKPKEELDDSKFAFERELTNIRDKNADLKDQIDHLETRLESTEQTLTNQISEVNERCQKIESMLEMIVRGISRGNHIEPVQMVDLELER